MTRIKSLRNWALCTVCILWYAQSRAQCPPNIGFENATTSGWECESGFVDRYGVATMSGGKMPTRHQVTEGADQDRYGHFPVVCPNGGLHSFKLGNDGTKAEAERISYTFTVPAGPSYTMVLNYAVVLQNPDHDAEQQPKFTARVFDIAANTYKECPSFDFVAATDLPGFKLSDVAKDGSKSFDIWVKDWSATTINFVGYAGKKIRLEFTTNDCSAGAHFGYAYFDLNEDCGQAISGASYCVDQPSLTLSAPAGFIYDWYYSNDMTHSLGSERTLTLSPVPPDGTGIALKVRPAFGAGCEDVMYTTVQRRYADFDFRASSEVYGCTESGADLAAPGVTLGSSGDFSISYLSDALNRVRVADPHAVKTAGTYYLEARGAEGCTVTRAVKVVLFSPEPPPPGQALRATFPATVDLSSAFVHLAGQRYDYFYDPDCRDPVANFRQVGEARTYYIRSTRTDYGCTLVTPVVVHIDPPPPLQITAPTTFTPNADGINDVFTVGYSNPLSGQRLKIYNRQGEVVHVSNGITSWDGTHNGKPVTTGTYYWVLEAMDPYSKHTVVRSAAITVLR